MRESRRNMNGVGCYGFVNKSDVIFPQIWGWRRKWSPAPWCTAPWGQKTNPTLDTLDMYWTRMPVLNLQGRTFGTRMKSRAVASCLQQPKNKGWGSIYWKLSKLLTDSGSILACALGACVQVRSQYQTQVHVLLRNLTLRRHYWQPGWEARCWQGGVGT